MLEAEVTSECPVPSLDVTLAVAREHDRGCAENAVKCDSQLAAQPHLPSQL